MDSISSHPAMQPGQQAGFGERLRNSKALLPTVAVLGVTTLALAAALVSGHISARDGVPEAQMALGPAPASQKAPARPAAKPATPDATRVAASSCANCGVVESVVAVLGTLLCGAAYVPIDPTYPMQRQQFLIDDSQLSLVVTSRQVGMPAIALGSATVVDIDTITSQTLTTDQLTTFEPTPTTADDLIYVLYTSGSTGRPNGVCGPNGPTLNRLRWGFEALPFDPSGQEVIAHRSSS